MIEIRVLITDQSDAINIQTTSGSSILAEDYFKKRRDMNLKAYVRERAIEVFNHALDICLDKFEFKELEL